MTLASHCVRFEVTKIDLADRRNVPHDFSGFIGHCKQSQAPLIRLYGRTAQGQAVMAYLAGASPYLYVAAPEQITERDLPVVSTFVHDNTGVTPRRIEIVRDKTDAHGMHARPRTVLRLVMERPHPDVTTVRDFWHDNIARTNGFTLCDMHFEPIVYEADVKYQQRVCIDMGLVPFAWVDVPKAHAQFWQDKSHCDITLVSHYRDVVVHKPEGEFFAHAPIRSLVLDCEMLSTTGAFPEPTRDPVIMISSEVSNSISDADSLVDSVVFCTCAGVASSDKPHSRVVLCPDERSMMLSWRDYVVAQRPDVFSGYNLDKFDWVYLVQRAEVLGFQSEFLDMCRYPGELMAMKKSNFQSQAHGRSEDYNIEHRGAINMDMLRAIQRSEKLRSYKLDDVAEAELEEKKDPVHHTQIPVLYYGDENDTRKLAEYCRKDSALARRLMFKKKTLLGYAQMARVTGVDVDTLVTGGEQVKVYTQMLTLCQELGFLLRTNKREQRTEDANDDEDMTTAPTANGKRRILGGGVAVPPPKKASKTKRKALYSGAVVIEPLRGFYELPITTLDFSSLYPSIIIAHNLSHDTLVMRGVGEQHCKHGHCAHSSAEVLKCGCVEQTPNGDRFWTARVRKGLLPIMCERLLNSRKAAKGEMAKCVKDSSDYVAYDVLQLKFKLSSNSVYGSTGAKHGKLACLAISASVTAYGREMINFIKTLVERKYTKANGYANDAVVVYGDTDSIMVKFGVGTVAEAIALGKHAAEFINASFNARLMSEDQVSEFLTKHAPDCTTMDEALFRYTDTLPQLVNALVRGAIAIIFEKVLWYYLLINKKRYAGGFWTRADKMDKIHQSGLESVRRDNCLFASGLVGHVIKLLMTTGNPLLALEHARERVKALSTGRVPLDELVISKGYSKNEDDYDPKSLSRQAHLIVNRKREQRDPGTGYKLGDRIPFLIIQNTNTLPGRPVRLMECVECVDYVKRNRLVPNAQYYLQNQVQKPLTRIFDSVWGEGASARLLFTPDIVTVLSWNFNSSKDVDDDENVAAPALNAAAAAVPSPATSAGLFARPLTLVSRHDRAALLPQPEVAVVVAAADVGDNAQPTLQQPAPHMCAPVNLAANVNAWKARPTQRTLGGGGGGSSGNVFGIVTLKHK